VLTSN
jgi:hypothetical protein